MTCMHNKEFSKLNKKKKTIEKWEKHIKLDISSKSIQDVKQAN